MKRYLQGSLWLGMYVLVSLSPLLLAMVGPHPPRRDFLTEFSVALGFVGLAMIGLQFVITARFRRVAAPYGLDIILRFHREISIAAFGIVLAHPLLILWRDQSLHILNLPAQPPRVWFGVFSLLALIAVIVTSIWRVRLRIPYETWRIAHGSLAIAALAMALGHVIGVGHYIAMPWKQALWIAMAAMSVILLLHVRVFKPWRMLHAPWRVERVKAERGNSWTITFRPIDHAGFRFEPGQFGWITLFTSPFAIEEHPFSFSSSALQTDTVEVTIKALGDFTGKIGALKEGDIAYIDGPFGAFTNERYEAPGFVFIAGGVGITPIMSMLRTLVDYQDTRPLLLIYANKCFEDVTFREELEELEQKWPNLAIVHVLEETPEDWSGEQGFVDAEVLERHLPEHRNRRQYFLCGPLPMLVNVELALRTVHVPQTHIHAELFNLV
ncbi:MAG: ferric reductase-like transmembrane domain-containing protein [Bradymonadaceae bacterium]|nr:ferric reductase-like transmembrane domain-containing protein [Lujinxingiaceae bacterium]